MINIYISSLSVKTKKMNLTTNNKLNRDYLGPVNTNISYQTTNIDTNQQIQIQK